MVPALLDPVPIRIEQLKLEIVDPLECLTVTV
jgi:hypothetical protein